MFPVVIVLMVQFLAAQCQEVIVDTNYGRIRGVVQEVNGEQFTVFMGIPFAAPPVNELRFKPAQRHEGWGDAVLNAVNISAACPQGPGVGYEGPLFPQRLVELTEDEDCLYLNIYISGDISSNDTSLLPVIVFIHGGAFGLGSAAFEIGDLFVTVAEPVVMVTIQYRLGALGFLSSGDEALSGNLGLKDQSFALRWVQDNIVNFRGNPDQVTICGESAGGESVLAHMISPMSAGLFHKASSMSPPVALLYQKKKVSRKYFKMLAEELDCSGRSEDILACLRTKPWQEILNVREVPYDALYSRVIDGEFITDDPKVLWSRGEFNDADLMVGFTSDEIGEAYVYYFNPAFASNRSADVQVFHGMMSYGMNWLLSDDNFLENLEIVQNGKPLQNYDDLVTVIKGRYYDSASTELLKARGLVDCVRDVLFGYFSLFVANKSAGRRGKVYMYLFDHRLELLGSNAANEVEFRAPHGGELPFQFGYGVTDASEIPMTPDELALTRSIIQAWTSFTTGNPSYFSMSGEEIEWPEYTVAERNILIFNTNMSAESTEDGEKSWQPILEFWEAISSLAQFEKESDNEKPWVVYPPTDTAASVFPLKALVVVALFFTI